LRLFVAIFPPTHIRDALATAIDELKETQADIKWVEAENIHLTVKFLGEVHEDLLPKMRVDLARIQLNAFEVHVGELGRFPPRGRPRVVWVGIQGKGDGGQQEERTQLRDLHAAVETTLCPMGFAPDGREFQAHLTLGRVRSPRNMDVLAQKIQGMCMKQFGVMRVESFSLMQSQLDRRGPTYVCVKQFDLGKIN